MDSLFSDNIFVGLSDDITDDILVNIHDQVAASLLYSQEKLSLFAQQANAQQRLVDIFGGNYDATVAESILQSWATGNFSTLPQIRVLDAASMPGILGGYADNVVYLNADFLANASSEQIGAVLLEEFGHWLDSQINTTDAAGDEGELFSASIRDVLLNEEQATAIRSENDHIQIVVDGTAITLEAAAPSNNNFSNRIVLNGVNVTTTGSNTEATGELGEPNHAGVSGNTANGTSGSLESVWWSWTAQNSGPTTIKAWFNFQDARVTLS